LAEGLEPGDGLAGGVECVEAAAVEVQVAFVVDAHAGTAEHDGVVDP